MRFSGFAPQGTDTSFGSAPSETNSSHIPTTPRGVVASSRDSARACTTARHARRGDHRAGLDARRRGVRRLLPRRQRCGRGSADRARHSRVRGVLQCHSVGSIGRPISDLGRNIHLRSGTTGAVVGLSGRLGIRCREDRQLRGDGAHLRRLRRAARLGAARSRSLQ